MKKSTIVIALSLGLATPFSAALAEGDVTMQVIQADLPDAVTRLISLPDDVAEEAGHADSGLDIANEARLRRLDGLDTAAEARANQQDGLSIADDVRNDGFSGDNNPGRP